MAASGLDPRLDFQLCTVRALDPIRVARSQRVGRPGRARLAGFFFMNKVSEQSRAQVVAEEPLDRRYVRLRIGVVGLNVLDSGQGQGQA
jgi:hypothetical protein